jgi:hypothetical protein
LLLTILNNQKGIACMRKITLLLAVVTTISGCTSLNKLSMDTKSVAQIKGQTVAYTSRKKPDFSAMTAGKASLGLLGALAMISEGNSIIASNKVSDPADVIATGLAKELENAHGVRLVTPPVTVEADDADQIAASVHEAARFVIDAQTIDWSFVYFATNWTHYRVIFTAKAVVVNNFRTPK